MTRAAYDSIAEWYETEFLAYQRRGGEDRDFADLIGIDRALADLLGPGDGTCLDRSSAAGG